MAAITSRDVEHVLRTVFKRCVKCPNEAPSCASLDCGKKICIQVAPDCNTCAYVKCVDDPNVSGSNAKSGPNVGAIAGGVAGGVAFVAIMVFVVWKYCLKGRRRKIEDGDWQEVDMAAQEKPNDDFVSRRSTRASTHTVASMASSVLTRASNIIQIAYIPGVTNRSGPGSPDLLVPPVPPIPAMSPSSGFSTPYSTTEQHFFVPDMRDSMASASTDARSSYARTSIAPSLARNSMASTVYRQNAIVSPLPAQTIVRGKAAVVSVKSSGSSSPSDTLTPGMETPPVPQIDPKHTLQPIRIQMPRMTSTSTNSSLSPQNSVRSTATLGPVRALNITKHKPSLENIPKRSGSTASQRATASPPESAMRPVTEISVVSSDDGVAHARARKARADVDSDSDSDDDDHSRARRSLLGAPSNRDSELTEIADTPGINQSPFSDNSAIDTSRPKLERHTSSSSAIRSPMTPIREESSKRGSHVSKRTQSPFDDDNRSDL